MCMVRLEAFHQHAGVPLDLFQPRGHLSTHLLELFTHFPTQLLELPVNRLESAIEILNEFLVHRDSVLGKSMLDCFPCQ